MSTPVARVIIVTYVAVRGLGQFEFLPGSPVNNGADSPDLESDAPRPICRLQRGLIFPPTLDDGGYSSVEAIPARWGLFQHESIKGTV